MDKDSQEAVFVALGIQTQTDRAVGLLEHAGARIEDIRRKIFRRISSVRCASWNLGMWGLMLEILTSYQSK